MPMAKWVPSWVRSNMFREGVTGTQKLLRMGSVVDGVRSRNEHRPGGTPGVAARHAHPRSPLWPPSASRTGRTRSKQQLLARTFPAGGKKAKNPRSIHAFALDPILVHERTWSWPDAKERGCTKPSSELLGPRLRATQSPASRGECGFLAIKSSIKWPFSGTVNNELL